MMKYINYWIMAKCGRMIRISSSAIFKWSWLHHSCLLGDSINHETWAKGAMRLNWVKLFLISSSTELTLLKLGPFLTMSDILMDIINGGLNISSGNPASAAIGYAMLLTCFLYPGKDVLWPGIFWVILKKRDSFL